ncbi:hypothetical protein MVEN_01039100 [Mycena venus]|uniref:NAD(P)-binding domain-containing protein n=1 Tax=Mycena venus TaxID=2733690 RepID=A0A8H7D0H4_9AGAR|nr:hypothetical protein MVEN_01039100 [Mycena venus]
MSIQKTALILGSTGQETRRSAVLSSKSSLPRRTLPASASLDAGTPRSTHLSTGKEKLEQKVIDFEKLEAAGLSEGKWDVVFITLGTTAKAAGSSEAFERIDREYVINAARAAKSEDHSQRLIYVSSAGADPKSHFLYPRSKGLTEEGLASLGYEDTIVFRPGLLAGTNRPELRVGEKVAEAVTSFGSLFTSSLQIKIGTLAKSLIKVGELGSAGLPPDAKATQGGKDGARFTLIGNSGALALAK